MKTRAWITAAMLTGALFLGMPAEASDSGAAAAGSGRVETAAGVGYGPSGESGAGEGAGFAETAVDNVSAAVPGLAEEAKALKEAGAFLDSRNLGNHMKYVAYPFIDVVKDHPGLYSPIGQLQVKKDGITMTADVVNFTVPKRDGQQMLDGLFTVDKEGNPSAEGTLKILLFNQALGKAPAFLNERILEGIAMARKRMGEPIPYSIMHVDFRSVEPLHRMNGDRTVYTTGSRILLYADGWIFPMYIKAYLYKEGDDYRTLGIFASDSVKTEAIEGGNQLIHQLTGAK